MTRHRMRHAPLLAALGLSACVMAPAHGPDDGVAPELPAIVELDVEPYYHGGFYYAYHRHDHRWTYSKSRTGPWKELPRERYPREVRYKDSD